MLTSTTHRAGALVTVIVVLTGVITLPAASADPNPDAQFVALLDQKGIPALENVPSLIATAHRICRQLDGGMPVDGVVDDMKQRAFNANAAGGPYPPDRVMRTVARFISASVEAYCPNNQPKIASLQSMANPVPGSDKPNLREPQSALHVVPAGETGQPDPPQLPPPPEPTAQILAPPPPVAPPLPRQQTPPPAQGPQQQPPASPAPGGAPGSGGGAPESPPMPPGRVRLAP